MMVLSKGMPRYITGHSKVMNRVKVSVKFLKGPIQGNKTKDLYGRTSSVLNPHTKGIPMCEKQLIVFVWSQVIN